jgi:uncharacterized protein
MTEREVIEKTSLFVKKTLKNTESGHDWFHIDRVRKLALKIGEIEKCNLFVVELAALLHDIADYKFHDGDEEAGPEKASSFLGNLIVDEEMIRHVSEIIRHISFKGGNNISSINTIEFKVVQDADRLDAIGAIGIARTFNYGGFKNRSIYNPEISPVVNQSKESYMNGDAPTINHFYEKLLLLKDRMNTKTAKKIAENRHVFMEKFLDEFFGEWEGRC